MFGFRLWRGGLSKNLAARCYGTAKGGRYCSKQVLQTELKTCLNKQHASIATRMLSTHGIDVPTHHDHQALLTKSYCHGIGGATLIGETIGQRMDKITEMYPDRECVVFVDDNKRATFADFREEVDKIAAGLLALGLKKGDRVGMWGPNCMEWTLVQYATARTGMILVNVNPAYRSHELNYALNKVGCKALIMLPSFKTSYYYDVLLDIAPELESSMPGELDLEKLPDLRHVILTEGDAKPGTFTLEDILNFGGIAERQQVHDIQSHLQFDDPINIQFTSGTTGSPKGATLTHHNIINNGNFMGYNLDFSQPDTRVCIPVPLYHCFAMVLGSLACMCHGVTAVYPSRGFSSELTLKAIHQEKCTAVYGTPTMFIDMLSNPNFDNYDYRSLRTGIMAGSPCPVEVMKQVIDKMHCREMTIAYGLTETSPGTNFTSPTDPLDLRVSTVGRPFPHVEAKVIDSDGDIVPVNTPGELCFRGYVVMPGYWNDEVKTKEAIDEHGWFHSGDLAVMDENEYCKIIGRLKDVVIRGGENVYPTEIEQFLYKHPKVQDVQVFGVEDERMGEEVCAWIRLQSDETCTEDEIKEFCRGKISHFKIPRYIQFVDEFPLTVTGKVKKFEMRKTMNIKLQSHLVTLLALHAHAIQTRILEVEDMHLELSIFTLVVVHLASECNANDINIVMLVTPSQAWFARELDRTLQHSIAYLDTRVLGNSGFLLKVKTVQVDKAAILSNGFLYGRHKYTIGNASFILLPYHFEEACILGDMLKVPMITLNYEPGILCKNVFSMKPDPIIMNQAVVTMIREDRPRVVAVVIEEGYGDFATAIMSLNQRLNHFVFQIIALVNFNNTTSVSRAVKELKESGTRKIFLAIHQESLYTFMREVHHQRFKSLHAYRWFTFVLDMENDYRLQPMEGLLSMSLPIDEEQFNVTMKDLRRMQPSNPPNSKDINPLIHDALATIAHATKQYRNQICIEQQAPPQQTPYCPVRTQGQTCKAIEEYLAETLFRGLTGDVKFTKSRYRNVTIMNANEVNLGRKVKLGIWSVPCEAFKWDPESTFAKQKGMAIKCRKADDEESITAFKPRKRNLRIVARVQSPFLFYDSLLKTTNPNDKFSGFCKDILDKLSKDLDFKYDLYLVPDGKYGTGKANHTLWNGMVGELIKKEADIAIGSLTISSSRESVVDFSKSFMEFTMALLYRKPDSSGKDSFQFLRPFSVGIWLSIFFSTLAVSIIIFIIEKFSPFGYRNLSLTNADYQGDELNLANSFWFAMASLLHQGPDHTPRSTAGRVLSAFFWMFVGVIVASYIAGLVSFFISPYSEYTIASLEDLTNQDRVKYGILQGGQTQRFFESTKHPLYRKMYTEMVKSSGMQPSIRSAAELVRKNEFAFLDDQPLLEYLNKQKPCNTKILKHLVTTQSYAFALQLSSEWTNPISIQTLHLKETGFIESLRMKWWDDHAECMKPRLSIRHHASLGFHNMAGIIAILAIGVSLSLIMLLFEVKCKSWAKCLQSKRSSLSKTEQKVLKAPQITYLDYKANGESYDMAFSKLYGSKGHELASLGGSFDEQQQRNYKDAPESTL
eukprot:gene8975-9933_t